MPLPIWAKNILFLLVYMISGLILVIIIEGLLSGTELQPLNAAIEGLIIDLRTPALTTLIVFIIKFGNPFLFSCLAIFLSALLAVKKNTYDALLFIIALIVSAAFLTVLKNVFQITRPVSEIYAADGWSFPSGHATVATSFFFLLAHIYFSKIRTVWGKTVLVLGSIIGALTVGFSRIYLGAHWTLDVLAGFALGLLSVSFTVLMFNLFLGDRRSLRKTIDM